MGDSHRAMCHRRVDTGKGEDDSFCLFPSLHILYHKQGLIKKCLDILH